jgi:deoxycytidine triphosphate deaminase
LGTEFIVTERQNYAHLDPLDAYENAYKIETTGKKQEFKDHDVRFRLIKRLSPLEPFILHPYEFALGSTLEYIRIPVDLVAQLEGRSTWARLGTLVHLTAGLIHPGSEGTITFELLNAGDLPIMLYPGLRIAQLVFYRLDKPYKLYDQAHEVKYSKNLRVSKPVYWEDEEVKVLYKARKARLEAEARKRRDNRCGE